MKQLHERKMTPQELLNEVRERYASGQEIDLMAQELNLPERTIRELVAKVKATLTLRDYRLPREEQLEYAKAARLKIAVQATESGIDANDPKMLKIGLEALRDILADVPAKPKPDAPIPAFDAAGQLSDEVTLEGLLDTSGEEPK